MVVLKQLPDLEGRYNIAILPRDEDEEGDEGHKDTANMNRIELKLMVFKMVLAPSFTHIKSLLLPSKYHSELSPVERAEASLLQTWTQASPKVIAEYNHMRESLIHGGSTAEQPGSDWDPSKWVYERHTTYHNNSVYFKTSPVYPDEPSKMLNLTLAGFCITLVTLNRNWSGQYPQSRMKIPLTSIRLRDIVVLRFFMHVLATANMTDLIVITDNMLHLERKEATEEPIWSFCASCLKLEVSQSRCAGCKVGFS